MSSTLTTSPEMSGRPARKGDFLTGISHFLAGMAQNPKGLLAAFVVLLAGIGSVSFFLKQKDTKAHAARGALFLAQKTYVDEMKVLAAAEKPIEKVKDPKAKSADQKKAAEQPPTAESLLYKKWDVDAKLPGAVSKFKVVAEEHAGTLSGNEAALTLGDLYFSHSEPAKAVSWFEKAVQGSRTLFDRSLALSSLGYALEASGKFPEAITTFEKAINQGEAALKGDLLLAIARCREAQKDYANAKLAYDNIITQLAGTEYAKKAELYKSQLE